MQNNIGVFIKKCEEMSNELFSVMGMEFEDTNEVDRQILSVLSFGMINSYALENKVSVDNVRIAFEYVLIKVFRYSNEQAQSFLSIIIEATNKDKNPVYNYIIHQGIDMYYEYLKNEEDVMFDRLMKIYLQLKNSK